MCLCWEVDIGYLLSFFYPQNVNSEKGKAQGFLEVVASMGDDPIRQWILSEGKATQITGIRSVGGGCINRANRYDTDAGSFFVKTNRSTGVSMFEGEALGLDAMYETRSIRVPKPFKSVLGRKLAEMHKVGKCEKGFGFDVDNTIGSTPQINTWTSDWIEFYGVHRLGYQLKLARQQYGDSLIYEKGCTDTPKIGPVQYPVLRGYGYASDTRGICVRYAIWRQRLVKNMAPLFEDVIIEPCLLHGDLWSGNISSDKNGEPVILDPACYCMFLLPEFFLNLNFIFITLNLDGHNEAEFGMSWCAGFGGPFYSSYFEVMPKQPGFEKRRDLYMLYHYLNHYNLFGSGYRSSAMSIIDDYLRMLKV
ncbi:hypothetical protein RD792_010630 [Penstemon davidsonii]|uniref:protein-ribulosamine 3-kinase n=1 Tax=Penstemon davidsonii TaxID=160366 RepID=A0ABR0D4B3_9LAMI|nr:hypothetical protein RD792_010630 [Penstemon davidsonii]